MAKSETGVRRAVKNSSLKQLTSATGLQGSRGSRTWLSLDESKNSQGRCCKQRLEPDTAIFARSHLVMVMVMVMGEL